MAKFNFNKIKPLNVDFGVDKMTTGNIQSLINALCKGRKVYLEIGAYQGATVLAAAHGNPKTKCFAVDNFSQFDKRGENEQIIRKAIEPYDNINLIVEDCTDAINMVKETDTTVDVFFYDGNHTHEETLQALIDIYPQMAADGFIVVDDTNWDYTMTAVERFLEISDFEIVFDKKTKRNGDPQWWNGITVLQRPTMKLTITGGNAKKKATARKKKKA